MLLLPYSPIKRSNWIVIKIVTYATQKMVDIKPIFQKDCNGLEDQMGVEKWEDNRRVFWAWCWEMQYSRTKKKQNLITSPSMYEDQL